MRARALIASDRAVNALLDRAKARHLDCIALLVDELNSSRADSDVRRQMESETFRIVHDVKRPDDSRVFRLAAIQHPTARYPLFEHLDDAPVVWRPFETADGTPILDDDGNPYPDVNVPVELKPVLDEHGRQQTVPVYIVVNRDVLGCENLHTQCISHLFRGRPYFDPLRCASAARPVLTGAV